MKKIIIQGASVVNEGKSQVLDVLISGERIEKIAAQINAPHAQVIPAEGKFLLPGVIDDQVHFREPGLTHKGDIQSESIAAVAGGVTSFMDMPNTLPNTLTQSLLQEKYDLAAKRSLANFSFFMGVNQTNLEEALKTDNENVCGITDDGLYFNDSKGILANYPEFLEILFSKSASLIALHSENDKIITDNENRFRQQFGENITMEVHSIIRSEEACLIATKQILEIAKKHNSRLHVLHVSTLAESQLFDSKIPIEKKRITAEACIPHLHFSQEDYNRLGAKIKWNPSIKTLEDKIGLLHALLENRLDIIATDHAPHSIMDKSGNYFQSHSGGPMVQHSLVAMLEFVQEGKITIEKLVEKMSHNVAEIYTIRERGYIREGYYADLVLVDLNHPWTVSSANILYKCRWSPFENRTFHSKVLKTFVNGHLVFDQGHILSDIKGQRLQFSKIR